MGTDFLNHRLERLKTRVEGLRPPDGAAPGAGSQWIRDALHWLDSAQSELREAEGRLDVARLISEAEAWRFRAFFGQVPMGFLITDLDGTILELNREAADILGETYHELLGSRIQPHLADRGRCLEGPSSGLDFVDCEGEFRVEIPGADSSLKAVAEVARRPDRSGDSAEYYWLLRRPEAGPAAPPPRAARRRDAWACRRPSTPPCDPRSALATILNSALLLSMMASGDEAQARQSYARIAKQVGHITRWIEASTRRPRANAFARED